jgi:UDP-N-acetylglucosamine 2-epimerase (non-hydrolysing)
MVVCRASADERRHFGARGHVNAEHGRTHQREGGDAQPIMPSECSPLGSVAPVPRVKPRGRPRVMLVVGARPNFIKIAPILRALRAADAFDLMLVHTGQHYDGAMNDVFFAELALPDPDIHLGVGSGSHAMQTGAVMQAIEPVIDRASPGLVVVVGDVNSTLAAALVAAKKGVPVAHVEAGLRSFDRAMPEEINRVLTDQISDLLFTTEREAERNLAREGIAADKVFFVGNVMIDSLLHALPRAVPPERLFERHGTGAFCGVLDGGFAAATLHRPSNVDDPDALRSLLATFGAIAERLPLVLPLHPRTARAIEQHGMAPLLDRPELLAVPPQPYLVMLGLMRAARLVLTDSGGIQEETTGLGVPCLTLRDNTERPITVSHGTNRVVGTEPAAILAAVEEILQTGGKRGRIPPLWDGRAADRIAGHLVDHFKLA